MTDQIPPRNRAERRAASRRTRQVAALGSGAVLAIGAAGGLSTLLAAAPAGAAAPIVVDSLADDGTGTTLREAIEAANAAAGQDAITFQTGLTGTITLASDLPNITDALDIQGPGAGAITVDGATQWKIFNFEGVDSTEGTNGVSGLTVTRGVGKNSDSSGGGVASTNSSADITISDAVITNNFASNDGGGVHMIGSSGTMTVRNTTISGNTSGAAGGGLYAWGEGGTTSVVVENSTISGNTASDGDGGGLYLSNVTATISGSTISGNTSSSSGGGAYARNTTLSVSNSTISGNTADDGGGLYLVNSPTTIEFTTISGNTASDGGGGGIKTGYYDESEIDAAAGGPDATLTIRNSTIADNTAQYYGGGLYITLAEQTTIENSTISGNSASQAGGIYGGYAGVTLTQVTVTNNEATNPDNGTAVGGIQFPGVSLVKSATGETGTDAKAPTDHAGEHAKGRADVSAAAVGTLESVGTIIAGNVGQDVGVYSGEVTLTTDHSVLGTVDDSVVVDDQGGTQSGVADPGLAPLASNGGPTQTHALLVGSVAINTGPVPEPTFPGNDSDQRGDGFARVVDGVVDVGAYEVQPPAEAPLLVITPRFTG